MKAVTMAWLTVLPTGLWLILCCAEASIMINGELWQHRPTKVVINCYFPFGTLDPYSLELSRRVDSDRSRRTQMLYKAVNSTAGERLINYLTSDVTTASGSLRQGVSYTLSRAQCQDAGVYICSYNFTTVMNHQQTNRNTNEQERLEMYPIRIGVSADPPAFRFSEMKEPVNATLNCSVFATAEVQWSWQFRPSSDTVITWSPFPQHQWWDQVPRLSDRCTHSMFTILTVEVTAQDRRRQIRCSVSVAGKPGAVTPGVFVFRELSRDDQRGHNIFSKALSTAGFVVLSILFFVILILLIHFVVPDWSTRLENTLSRTAGGFLRQRGRRRRRRHSQHPNRRPNDQEEPERVHAAGAANGDNDNPRPPNRRRRGSRRDELNAAFPGGDGSDRVSLHTRLDREIAAMIDSYPDLDLDEQGAEADEASAMSKGKLGRFWSMEKDDDESSHDDVDDDEESIRTQGRNSSCVDFVNISLGPDASSQQVPQGVPSVSGVEAMTTTAPGTTRNPPQGPPSSRTASDIPPTSSQKPKLTPPAHFLDAASEVVVGTKGSRVPVKSVTSTPAVPKASTKILSDSASFLSAARRLVNTDSSREAQTNLRDSTIEVGAGTPETAPIILPDGTPPVGTATDVAPAASCDVPASPEVARDDEIPKTTEK